MQQDRDQCRYTGDGKVPFFRAPSVLNAGARSTFRTHIRITQLPPSKRTLPQIIRVSGEKISGIGCPLHSLTPHFRSPGTCLWQANSTTAFGSNPRGINFFSLVGSKRAQVGTFSQGAEDGGDADDAGHTSVFAFVGSRARLQQENTIHVDGDDPVPKIFRFLR